MANIIREKENFLPLINGVKFEQIAHGVSVSADVPDDVAAVFLAVPGYRAATEDDQVPQHLIAAVKEPAPAVPPRETAAQRKAREKAEAEAKAKEDAAAKAAEDAAAAEAEKATEADAEKAAAEQQGSEEGAAGAVDESNEEQVF
ncbi:hypothetical protein [Kaistia sp. 32K]|uniref:hypothetical protein n=1 Tax=Kaistia sp. 32K TaxID=2795690 RepID=UPI0019165A40|nr:hypothetical protein [Kaistia sp. 32K]